MPLSELRDLLQNVGLSNAEASSFIARIEREIADGNVRDRQALELFCTNFLTNHLAVESAVRKSLTAKVGSKLTRVIEAVVLGVAGNAAYAEIPNAWARLKREGQQVRKEIEEGISLSKLMWPVGCKVGSDNLLLHYWDDPTCGPFRLTFNVKKDIPVVATASGRTSCIGRVDTSMYNEVFFSIDHGEGLASLYRYLGKVVLADNEYVDRGSRIGSLAWGDGELWVVQNGKVVNLLPFLPVTLFAVDRYKERGSYTEPYHLSYLPGRRDFNHPS